MNNGESIPECIAISRGFDGVSEGFSWPMGVVWIVRGSGFGVSLVPAPEPPEIGGLPNAPEFEVPFDVGRNIWLSLTV